MLGSSHSQWFGGQLVLAGVGWIALVCKVHAAGLDHSFALYTQSTVLFDAAGRPDTGGVPSQA